MNTWSKQKGAALILVAWTATLFALWQLATHLPIYFDESYNINLASTLAATGVYKTYAVNFSALFDPAITTGPTLMVPVAGAFRIFGTNLLVLRLTLLVIFGAALLVTMFALSDWLDPLSACVYVVALFSTSVVFNGALTLFGDSFAILSATTGFSLLATAQRQLSARRLLASGVCFGLAVLTKDIFALAIAFVFVAAIVNWLKDKRLIQFLPVVVAIGMFVAWKAYQYTVANMTLDREQYSLWLDYVVSRAQFMTVEFAWSPLSNVAVGLNRILTIYSQNYLLLVIVIVACGMASQLNWWRTWEPMYIAPLAVLLLSAFWFIWFVFLAGPSIGYHHISPGVAMAELAAVCIWHIFLRNHENRLFSKFVTLSCAAILAYAMQHESIHLYKTTTSFEPRLKAQHDAADWVSANIPANAPISGWGWFVPWDLAFLGNRIPARVDPGTYELKGLSEWFVIGPDWSSTIFSEIHRRNTILATRQPVFDNGYYKIYHVPIVLKILHPSETITGVPFNVQPGGDAALGITAENASPATKIYWDNTQLDSVVGSPTAVSAIVPAHLFAEPGRYEIYLDDGVRRSESAYFEVVSP